VDSSSCSLILRPGVSEPFAADWVYWSSVVDHRCFRELTAAIANGWDQSSPCPFSSSGGPISASSMKNRNTGGVADGAPLHCRNRRPLKKRMQRCWSRGSSGGVAHLQAQVLGGRLLGPNLSHARTCTSPGARRWSRSSPTTRPRRIQRGPSLNLITLGGIAEQRQSCRKRGAVQDIVPQWRACVFILWTPLVALCRFREPDYFTRLTGGGRPSVSPAGRCGPPRPAEPPALSFRSRRMSRAGDSLIWRHCRSMFVLTREWISHNKEFETKRAGIESGAQCKGSAAGREQRRLRRVPPLH